MCELDGAKVLFFWDIHKQNQIFFYICKKLVLGVFPWGGCT